jgi:hypothetical protein
VVSKTPSERAEATRDGRELLRRLKLKPLEMHGVDDDGTYWPTKDEQRAIDALHRLAKRWPKTLWLYSASGDLCVMRLGEDGLRVFAEGVFDPDYLVDTIAGIPNDGGDW